MYSKGFRFKETELGMFANVPYQIVNHIKQGCRIMGLTRGDFSLIDLIYAILNKIGSSDVIICTWSAGIKDANQVKWMFETNLIKSILIVTDHSYATRQKKYALAVSDLFGDDNIRTSEIHAKFVLIKNDNYSIVINTSMNLNANRTCESFEINDDTDIYKFYKEFIDEIAKGMPNGFEKSSETARKVIDRVFNTETKMSSTWSEL